MNGCLNIMLINLDICLSFLMSWFMICCEFVCYVKKTCDKIRAAKLINSSFQLRKNYGLVMENHAFFGLVTDWSRNTGMFYIDFSLMGRNWFCILRYRNELWLITYDLLLNVFFSSGLLANIKPGWVMSYVMWRN